MRSSARWMVAGAVAACAAVAAIGYGATGAEGPALAAQEVAGTTRSASAPVADTESGLWAEDVYEALQDPPAGTAMVLKKREDGMFHFAEWRELPNPAAFAGTKGTSAPRPTPPEVLTQP